MSATALEPTEKPDPCTFAHDWRWEHTTHGDGGRERVEMFRCARPGCTLVKVVTTVYRNLEVRA